MNGIAVEEGATRRNGGTMTTRPSQPRLDTIVTRQRSSRIRDIAFALLVVVAGAVSLSTVSYAAHAANQSELAKR
jgi:hypothetical protein